MGPYITYGPDKARRAKNVGSVGWRAPRSGVSTLEGVPGAWNASPVPAANVPVGKCHTHRTKTRMSS